MQSSFVAAIFLLLCIASAIAQPPVPELPTQFEAKVTLTFPIIGTGPGLIYYDYLNQRVRYDTQSMFGDSIAIQRYDIEQPTEYDIFGSDCQSKLLNDTMNSMDIPPFATYVGPDVINDTPCDHWTVSLFGFGNLDWWVSNSTDTTSGKVTYQYVRFAESAIGTQIDFGQTIVGPVDYSYFDVSTLGCPAPVPPVTYTVSGYVKNAINNNIIAGASVYLADGTTATTDANGKYSFTGLSAGNVSINATAKGYFLSQITLQLTDNIPAGTLADFVLSPVLASGQFRAVLTWAALPTDLDAHMKTPNGCEVYYRNRACGSISLDVDQRQGFGPETVTINGFQVTGTYTYYVINYSGEKPLTTSNGRIQVYGSQGLLADISVPTTGTASYRYWVGFTIDQTGAVTVVNTIVPSV
jgi:hypothetical protein